MVYCPLLETHTRSAANDTLDGVFLDDILLDFDPKAGFRGDVHRPVLDLGIARSHPLLEAQAGAMAHKDTMRSLELLGREVIPELKKM